MQALLVKLGLEAAVLGGAAAALVAAWRVVKKTRAFLATAVRAEGTVTAVRSRLSQDSDGKMVTYYAAVISFESGSGRRHTCTGGGWTTWKPRLARKVRVPYDPQDPNDARTSSLLMLWGIPGLVVVIGLLLLAAAVAIAFL